MESVGEVSEYGGIDNVVIELDDSSSDSSGDEAESSARSEERNSFGNVGVAKSKDVHLGNKTFYRGQVTIVYSSSDPQSKRSEDAELLPQLSVEQLFFHNSSHSNQVNAPEDCLSPVSQSNSSNSEVEDDVLKPITSINYWKYRHIASLVVFSVVVVVIITSLVVFLPRVLTRSEDLQELNVSDLDDSSTNRSQKLIRGFEPLKALMKIVETVIQRNEWLTQPPVDKMAVLQQPVPYVINSHTATERCANQAECTRLIRFMQTLNIDGDGWLDIAYNFLIGGDTYSYVGRGWDTVGAHSYGYNQCSIGISFVARSLGKILLRDSCWPLSS